MTRSVLLLSLALILSACSGGTSPAPASSSTSDAIAQIDSVTWPSSQQDVLGLFRRMPDRIGQHDLIDMGASTLGATYGSSDPGAADIVVYAMPLRELGIPASPADPLAELRKAVGTTPGMREESSSAGGDGLSASFAATAPVDPRTPNDLRHVIAWMPPEQKWVYLISAKDMDDRDAAVAAMIGAAKGTGSVSPPVAPLGLGEISWPKDSAGAKALLASMPDQVAGLPKNDPMYGGTALTYGDGTSGNEPIQILASGIPAGHRQEIATMPYATIGMGFPVKQVESSNDDPATPLVWFEATVGSPSPGGSGGYAIAWASMDGSVVYVVVTKNGPQRVAAVEAMAAAASS